MVTAMSDLEKYINENQDYDPLVRAALIHYQFETIHPFLDGNGRIGRLLILLYLMEQGLLKEPVIYVSYFLKKNQVEYYDRISEVRRKRKLRAMGKILLGGSRFRSLRCYGIYKKLSKLHEKNIALLPKPKRKKDNLRMLFDYLESILSLILSTHQSS